MLPAHTLNLADLVAIKALRRASQFAEEGLSDGAPFFSATAPRRFFPLDSAFSSLNAGLAREAAVRGWPGLAGPPRGSR